MPRGGRRPAGERKSQTEFQKWRAMLDECIQPADWQAIIQKDYDEAMQGGRLGAVVRKWLTERRFGVTTEMMADDSELPPIQYIEVVNVVKVGQVQEVDTLIKGRANRHLTRPLTQGEKSGRDSAMAVTTGLGQLFDLLNRCIILSG